MENQHRMSNAADRRSKVLFLSTGNSARTQMAEALLRAAASDYFDVHSAGMEPGQIHPLATQVMKEIGIDIATQRAKGVKQFLGKVGFQYAIILCDQASRECPKHFLSATHLLFWPFP